MTATPPPVAEPVQDNPIDIHEWFGLSYSNYLVLPRALLQSMPLEWQHRFTALLTEMGGAFAHVEQAEAFIVTAARETTYGSLSMSERHRLGVTPGSMAPGRGADVFYDRDSVEHPGGDPVLAPLPGGDPVPHYDRGRTHIEPRTT